jgi:hypothetical protein
MTHTPAIPADINNLQSIASTLSDMIEMAWKAHNNCDIDSETECGGEQCDDGSADEHCRLRDAEATVELLKHKATADAGKGHVISARPITTNVEFGCPHYTVDQGCPLHGETCS